MNEAEILKLVGLQTPGTRTEVNEIAVKLIYKADQYYKPLAGLIVPEFKYDLTGRTAGQAIARRSTQDYAVRLNNPALLNPELKDYMLRQVVPHEIAHTVVHQLWPSQPSHGWRWAEVMRLFEVPPLRTHNLPLAQARKTRRFIHLCLGCDKPYNIGLNAHRKLSAKPGYYVCTVPHCRGKLSSYGKEVLS